MEALKETSGVQTGAGVRARARTPFTKIRKGWRLYALIALPLIYIIIFKYVPMYGAQIAFKNFIVTKGIWDSEWVGFKHFDRFFHSYEFWRLMSNTILLSVYSLVAGFPFPIILALSLNYVKNQLFKKSVQMITYAPHFISVVVMVGIILELLEPRNGIVNNVLKLIGLNPINFMGVPEYFKSIYVWSGIWQSVGFGCIIYLAALASIDPALHEAAVVDGANKLQRMWHIDLPGIMPIAIIMLIMNTGHMLDVGFEKVLLMQNPLNIRTSEVIDTYVYKVGLTSQALNYSYPTAIGLFKSVINLILLIMVNKIAQKTKQASLW
ncbi:ABC transporter permease subunit [Paenibacillus vulneris]|uniref:ABC transporter permease n=1 Tax=Paenibacillus vulneris TaxID=1133364 RepID=A0ABW3UH36_9BACL|nr:ABC transporter permease subunit [Paenibacillus sp. 32352]